MEINWSQVIATVLGSGVISALLTGLWLNTRTEKIKSELQRNLYEFQTRFSLYHQRKADAITKLYEILIDLEEVVDYVHDTFSEDVRKRTTQEAQDKFSEYIDTYKKSRIYFDDDLCKLIEEVKILVNTMLRSYINSNNFFGARYSAESEKINKRIDKAHENEDETHQRFKEQFPILQDKLRNEFRQLLSAENPNNQLRKKR